MHTRRTFFRFAAVVAALLSLAIPARSVIPANDIRTTLSKLLQELRMSHEAALESDSLLLNSVQRREHLAEMRKSVDEVTILLYTQRPEFSFDMAFALENVSRIYDSFQEQSRLSDRFLKTSRSGLRRYTLLGESLREMYPRQQADSLAAQDSLTLQLTPALQEEADPERTALLDSCLFYTDALTALYGESVRNALQDSLYFADAESRLQQAYDYAKENYDETQKNRYIGGDVNIVQILKNWNTVVPYAMNDLKNRYRAAPDTESGERPVRTWDGQYVLRYSLLSLILLLASFLVASLVTRLAFRFVRREKVRPFRPVVSAILAALLFVVSVVVVDAGRNNPYWKMAYHLLSQFSWLTLAIFVSLLIRIRGDQAKASLRIYIPTLLLAFLCILLRASFLPASVVPLLLPPALLLFLGWQILANVRCRKQVPKADLSYMWLSVGVMAAACILSLAGYSMIGVLLLTFWTFQLAILHTITTLFYLIKRQGESRLMRKKARYHAENPELPLDSENAFIEVTWLSDLVQKVIVPIALIVSFPVSVQFTVSAYQLSTTSGDFMNRPLVRWAGFEYLTLQNLLIVLALFFVFRYLLYMIKGLSRVARLRREAEKRNGSGIPLKESDVNLSLSNTLSSLLVWMLFVIIVFSILHIPTSAITTITTGLAAGVGFALKDLINNFFYGIQLMAGRIRVGDKISCDGVRGIVKRVSYQTTQVEDEDGSLIAFTNTELFSKKFRNLNTGRNYEFLKIPVGVRYGTDVELARQVILEAVKPLMTKDKAGRDIVDPSFPVDVRFDGFGDSSVNLVVALYTTVETHYTFPSRAKEAIYRAFRENGIEIPFPQRDVYVKTVNLPKKEDSSDR